MSTAPVPLPREEIRPPRVRMTVLGVVPAAGGGALVAIGACSGSASGR